MSKYIFSRLEWDDEFDFDCDDREINEYFRLGRPASQKILPSVSYRLTSQQGLDVAFVTLANNYFQGYDENSSGPSVNIVALGVNKKDQSE